MDEPDALNCQEFVELVTEYLEETLSPADRARFDAHLAECDPCVDYIAQMRLTIRALGRLREAHVPAEARSRLLAAFRGWKHASGVV
jgi:anti-sigma factor RsiW